LYTLCAGNVAWQTGQVLATDEANRQLQLTQEGKSTFDIKGNRISNYTPGQVMTVNDLETVLYNVRQFIQSAIIINRQLIAYDSPDLKKMALDLQNYINNIKIDRMTVKTIILGSSIPLHILCQQLGLPYNAADRLLRLNPQITCPNFCVGPMQVYVS